MSHWCPRLSLIARDVNYAFWINIRIFVKESASNCDMKVILLLDPSFQRFIGQGLTKGMPVKQVKSAKMSQKMTIACHKDNTLHLIQPRYQIMMSKIILWKSMPMES